MNREMIMGEDLYFDSQPEPILPQELFEQLKASGQATASRILQELTRLADEGDAEARQMLTRLGAMAVQLKENPGAELLPENWVRYRQVNWRYTVLEGHLLALAWLMTGARFIPIVRGAEPVWERPAAEPARPMPSSSAEEKEAALSSPHAEAREEVIQVELRLLHLVERAGSPIPPALFQALPPERCTPAEVLFHLNMLALQGDLPAQKAMEKVDELAAQCREGTPLPPVSCREQNGVLVVAGEELSCLAAVAVGRENVSCSMIGEEKEVPKAIKPPASTVPAPQPLSAPAGEWQELEAEIARFAAARTSYPGLRQAREIHRLLEALVRLMPEELIREKAGIAAEGSLTDRARRKGAKTCLCQKLGISYRHLNQLLRLLSLEPTVQKEAGQLAEAQLRPILRLRDRTVQLAIVRGILHLQAERSTPARPWRYPSRAVQRLVNLVLEGTPVKTALVRALERTPRRTSGTLLDQMRILARQLEAAAERPGDLSPDDFMSAYKALQMALGKLMQRLKDKNQKL